MGNVERCDKTLALNEMIFYVRGDARLRERFATDLEGLCREFGLTSAEYEALRDQDFKRLNDMGVHQYYLPQILRLFYGTLERMEAAGSGGTAELLAWMLVLAFTAGPADVLAYMPAVAWRSGTGMVAWNEFSA